MARDYEIETVREGFGLTAFRVFQYTPGMVVSKRLNQGSNVFPDKEYETEAGPVKDEPYVTRKSALNTPVFDHFNILGRVQYTQFINGREQEVILDSFTPIDTVVYTVSQPKNIITTQIQGSEFGGSVKEYISRGDYQITIQGGIFGQNGVYPKDGVQSLIEYLEAPVPLNIDSRFLTLFSIQKIVVEDYQFFQRKGRPSEQLFEIRATSDIDPQLIL